jgi:poly-gamma-glutamate synthesis protein (capsule biosynthesis protein)
MLGRGVSQKLRHHPPEWFWGDSLPILRQADAVIANLEAPITTSNDRWRRTWKFFHFKADPEAVRILTTANVRFVCLANNHILDYGARGLLDTMAALDRAGIRHAGAGRNVAEASASQMLDLSGLKVGLVAATDNVPEFAATLDGPGTNLLEFRPDSPGLDWIERSVSRLRRAGVALVILSVHWGPNMRIAPSQDFRRFAHAAVERGIDIVHGHSAHVVQAIECYASGVILYDTGNFIDDYWKFPFRRTIWSFVFNLIVENGRPSRLRLVPILIHSSPLGVATGKVFSAITGRMRSLCAAFGTTVVDTVDGLEVVLA